MKNIFCGVFFILFIMPVSAGQWVVLDSSNINNFQIAQAGNSTGAPEALYIGLKSDIAGEVSSYCPRKNFLAITDSKLIDRIYSGILFGIASNKTMQFWADGAGKCVADIPLVTMFIIFP
jgi:hypothetical protein